MGARWTQVGSQLEHGLGLDTSNHQLPMPSTAPAAELSLHVTAVHDDTVELFKVSAS